MKKSPALLLTLLFASGLVLAQTPSASPASVPMSAKSGVTGQQHPQADCLAAIARERRDFAGAVEQGLQLGRLDPKHKPRLDRILAEVTALEASAKADRAISAKDCKALYQRIVAENSGIQMTMRSNLYRPK